MLDGFKWYVVAAWSLFRWEGVDGIGQLFILAKYGHSCDVDA